MLLSHKYKFIFIKTKKTAGTSIEIELNKLMSDKDIVTPIKPSHPDHKPRNYIYGKNKLFNHIMITDLKKIIPENIYKTYYKFCVEREPVDKCISHYSMLKNSSTHNYATKNLSWEEYIRSKNFPIDTKKYTDEQNNICVDKIIKYENLNKEMFLLASQLGFELSGIRERAKSNFRENINIKESDKKIIYEFFAESNKITGYELNNLNPNF